MGPTMGNKSITQQAKVIGTCSIPACNILYPPTLLRLLLLARWPLQGAAAIMGREAAAELINCRLVKPTNQAMENPDAKGCHSAVRQLLLPLSAALGSEP